jgi:hypothetical protein
MGDAMELAYGKNIHYDGSQLRSGWIAETFGVPGDAIAVFTGSCDVTPEHMLDLEDLQAGETIRAKRMLHFIVEHAGAELPLMVARQRLLVSLARDTLLRRRNISGLIRQGDDLFVGRRKLSVSIAAVSPTSGLIHFAVNVDPDGAPVPAIGLREIEVNESSLGRAIAEAYVAEIASCDHAATKVRPAL